MGDRHVDSDLEPLEKPAVLSQTSGQTAHTESVQVSVVLPCYNEEGSLAELYRRLIATLDGLGCSYEVILVNDGSTDRTYELMLQLYGQDPRLTIIDLSSNFGQTAGLAAGFAHARGEIIVSMDADLQHDPADLPRLLEKIDEGYDIASGWRSVLLVSSPYHMRRAVWTMRRVAPEITVVPRPGESILCPCLGGECRADPGHPPGGCGHCGLLVAGLDLETNHPVRNSSSYKLQSQLLQRYDRFSNRRYHRLWYDEVKRFSFQLRSNCILACGSFVLP